MSASVRRPWRAPHRQFPRQAATSTPPAVDQDGSPRPSTSRATRRAADPPIAANIAAAATEGPRLQRRGRGEGARRAMHSVSIQAGEVPSGLEPDPRRGELLGGRSEEHTSELQSLMRISYAVFCLKKKKTQ